MKQEIKFSNIAYFPFPLKGHLIGYNNLFNTLSQKHGVDIYVHKGKYDANFSNVIRLKSKEDVEEDPFIFKTIYELSHDAVAEVEEIWSKANYKPKLILADLFGLHGFILAKKHNVPAINLFSAFPVPNTYMESVAQMFLQNPFLQENLAKMKQDFEKMETAHNVKINKVHGIPNLGNLIDCEAILSYSPPEYPHIAKGEPYTLCGPILREEKVGCSFDFEKYQDKKFVYISLGTVFNFNEKFYQMVIDSFNETFSESHVFLISLSNKNIKEKLSVSNDFESLEKKGLIISSFWNQIEILEKCDLFITHGGHNSYLEGMFRKCPMICYPQGADQFYIAQEIKRLGFGEVIGHDVTIELLASTIKKVLADPSYKNNLSVCSSWFNTQKAVENHINVIEKYIF
jgi:MGT family glycosyltransferase